MSKIKKEDIFDSNLFKGTTEEIKTMIEVVKTLKTEMISLLKVSQQALKSKPTNSDGIRKQAEETQKVSQAEKNLIILEKERVKLVNKLNQASEKQAKNNARTKVRIQERNKALKQQAREELKLVGAYEKQSRTLNSLRKQYKDLLVQGKGNTKQARLLAKEVQNLDKKLKSVDAAAGQYQRNVGNYGNKLRSGFQSLMGAVGVTAGITGIVRGLRGAISVVVDFDQAIANLGAISQATDSEMIALEENARKLGGSTAFTATQVASLSTELAKLGFKPDEIIASSEAILQLAQATGSELPRSAEIAGSTLRAFGLEANEMERVASVLGVATTKSALNMEFFGTAMSKVAPVSAKLGFSLEDTTALLGTLANAGFDASTAATSTKNILLKLADSGGELAKALGEPVRNVEDFIPALSKLQAELGEDGLARALELTDQRSVAAFATFLEGTETINELKTGVTDVADELKKMSEDQLDTVNGQFQLLKSRLQELILGTSSTTGAVDKLKNALAFVTANLENIFRIIKYVAIAFISYKTAVIASNVAMTSYQMITKGARVITSLFSKGLKGAAISMKGLNTAIKSNPLGLLISALTTAIALFWDYSDSVEQASIDNQKFADSFKLLKDSLSDDLSGIESETKAKIQSIQLELAKLQQTGTDEEILGKQAELDAAQLEGLEQQIEAVTSKINEQREAIKSVARESLMDAFQENDDIREMGYGSSDWRSVQKIIDENVSKMEEGKQLEIELSKMLVFVQKKYNEDGIKAKADLMQQALEQGNVEVGNLKTLLDQLKAIQQQKKDLKFNTELRKTNGKEEKSNLRTVEVINKEIAEQQRLLKETATTRAEAKVFQNNIKKLEKERLGILGSTNRKTVIRNKYEDDLNKILSDREKLTRKIEKNTRGYLIGQAERDQETTFNRGLKIAEDETKVDIDKDGVIDKSFYDDKIFNDIEESFQALFYAEREGLKENRNYSYTQAEKRNSDNKKLYAKQLKDRQLTQNQYDDLIKQSEKNLKKDREEILQTYNYAVEESEQKRVDDTKRANEDIIKAAQVTADSQLKITQANEEARLKSLSDTIAATNALLDYFQRQNDLRAERQLQNINEEISASKNRYNELKQLSINGNADAEKSALSEERRQQELELKKRKVQRNQQLFNAGIAAFKVFASKVESGDKSPLTSTIKDITALTAFIQSLPAFYGGTENVGDSLGKPLMSGRDGHVVRVDSSERIVDPSNNAKLDGISNDELGNLALDYKSKSIEGIKYNKVPTSNYEMIANNISVNYQLNKKLDEISRSNNKIISAIEHIPFESWNYDEMSNAVIQKIKNQKKTEIKHYKNNNIF